MTRIGILYKVEDLIKDKTSEERYQERQKQSRPVVDALFEWLHSMEDSFAKSRKHTAKKIRSALRRQIGYVKRDLGYLEQFMSDGYAMTGKDQ